MGVRSNEGYQGRGRANGHTLGRTSFFFGPSRGSLPLKTENLAPVHQARRRTPSHFFGHAQRRAHRLPDRLLLRRLLFSYLRNHDEPLLPPFGANDGPQNLAQLRQARHIGAPY